MVELPGCVGFEPHIFVVKPSEIFDCPLCLNVLNEPRQCPKGHSFCKSCIELALNKKEECPICKTKLKINMLGNNLIAQQCIEKMESFCPSTDGIEKSSESCQWTGPFHSRSMHMTNECGCVIMSCRTLCGEIFQRKELNSHNIICPNFLLPCEFCCDHDTQLYKRSDLAMHQLDCDYRVVPCEKNCGSLVSYKNMSYHIENCPLTMVSCPLNELGIENHFCVDGGLLPLHQMQLHLLGGTNIRKTVREIIKQNKTAIEKLEMNVTTLQSDNANMKAQHQLELTTLTAKLDHLQSESQQQKELHNADIESLKKSVSHLLTESLLYKEVARINMNKMDTIVSQNDKLVQDIDHLKHELNEKDAKISNLEAKFESNQSEICRDLESMCYDIDEVRHNYTNYTTDYDKRLDLMATGNKEMLIFFEKFLAENYFTKKQNYYSTDHVIESSTAVSKTVLEPKCIELGSNSTILSGVVTDKNNDVQDSTYSSNSNNDTTNIATNNSDNNENMVAQTKIANIAQSKRVVVDKKNNNDALRRAFAKGSLFSGSDRKTSVESITVIPSPALTRTKDNTELNYLVKRAVYVSGAIHPDLNGYYSLIRLDDVNGEKIVYSYTHELETGNSRKKLAYIFPTSDSVWCVHLGKEVVYKHHKAPSDAFFPKNKADWILEEKFMENNVKNEPFLVEILHSPYEPFHIL